MTYFLELPVYRLEAEQYYNDREMFVEEHMRHGSPCLDQLIRAHYAACPGREQWWREHLAFCYGGAWDYNEIIGYIRLHFVGTQIRGEYWQARAKRIVRTRRKIFEWKTWKLANEVDIPQNAANPEVAALVRHYVAKCRHELRGRLVDSTQLEALAPYIDWRALISARQQAARD